MGSQISKADSDLLRSHTALLKAHILKKACLDHDINSLTIRQNYSKFNPGKRNFKLMFTARKAMRTLLLNARLAKTQLAQHSPKIHGYLPVLDSNLISEFRSEANQLFDDVNMANQRELTRIDVLKGKLENLKNLLQQRKRTLERNKRKIEGIQIVKDLCEGKQKTSQLLQILNDNGSRKKGTLRIDSISTAASESYGHLHVKNSYSMKTDDLDLEDVEVSKLDLSMQVPRKKSADMCPKKCFKLSENALLLRAKLLLKNDMESIIKKNKKIMKKSMKKTRALVSRYELVEYAFETDPQAYLDKLVNEIEVREEDLNSIICKRDYLKALNSYEKSDQESLPESPGELNSDSYQIIIN